MSPLSLNRSLVFLLSLSLPSAVGAQAAPDLSDPEVAHVAVTAGNIDVDLAKLAESRARHANVKQFAAMMDRDHTAVNARAAALASKLGVTPKDNPVSQSLLAGAKEAKTRIEAARGDAFDRAYIEREIAFHQAVLDALDQVLIPTTENAELKALLVEVRPAFQAHLSYAKQVAGKVTASR